MLIHVKPKRVNPNYLKHEWHASPKLKSASSSYLKHAWNISPKLKSASSSCLKHKRNELPTHGLRLLRMKPLSKTEKNLIDTWFQISLHMSMLQNAWSRDSRYVVKHMCFWTANLFWPWAKIDEVFIWVFRGPSHPASCVTRRHVHLCHEKTWLLDGCRVGLCAFMWRGSLKPVSAYGWFSV